MDTRQLVIGQRVTCALHWAGPGIVVAIHGPQTPDTVKSLGGGCVVMGGTATFDVAFTSGHLSKQVPESILRGIQWTISDDVAAAEEITRALWACNDAEQKRATAAEEAATRREVQRAAIPAEHPDLERRDTSKKSSHAMAAANIRRELRRAFPAVKFSVTSDSFSGGNSVDIHWTDGPTTDQVKAITGKYEEGSFDGMTDSYTYDHDNVFPEIFGGAKYVMEQRAYTLAGLRTAWQKAGHNPEEVTEGFDRAFGQEAESFRHWLMQAWSETTL